MEHFMFRPRNFFFGCVFRFFFRSRNYRKIENCMFGGSWEFLDTIGMSAMKNDPQWKDFQVSTTFGRGVKGDITIFASTCGQKWLSQICEIYVALRSCCRSFQVRCRPLRFEVAPLSIVPGSMSTGQGSMSTFEVRFRLFRVRYRSFNFWYRSLKAQCQSLKVRSFISQPRTKNYKKFPSGPCGFDH